MATKARDVSSSSSLIRIYHRLCNSSRRGISRAEFLEVYGLDEYTIFGSGNKRKAETIAKKFERAKDCLRDAGITFKHVERDGKSYYVYTPVPNPLLDWELKLEDAQFLMSLCRAWEGTELESSAHRMMRKIILSVPTLSASTRLEELEEPLQRIRLSDDSHLEEIFSAFSDHKTIDMDYGDLNTRHSENLSVTAIGILRRTIPLERVLRLRRKNRIMRISTALSAFRVCASTVVNSSKRILFGLVKRLIFKPCFLKTFRAMPVPCPPYL